MKIKKALFSFAVLITLGLAEPLSAQIAPTGGMPLTGPAAGAPYGGGGPSYDGMLASYEGVACDSCGADAGSCGCGGGLGSGGLSGLFTGFWLDADYLLWWSKERYVPVLATTSPNGTAAAIAGELGRTTTSILFGDQFLGGDAESGFRISSGTWIDPGRTLGFGGRYFFVGGEEDGYQASSDGNPILARPFFNVSTGTADSLLVAYPGISSGSLNIVATNEASGFDFFLRRLLLTGNCNRLDFIGGYQHTLVEDEVRVGDTIITEDPAGRFPVGTRLQTTDVFNVENAFDGGFIGLMGVADDSRLTWRMLTKVAFGNMNQEGTIRGTTDATIPGGPSAHSNQGLLALNSNIGTLSQDKFAIVPELNLSVSYKLTSNVQLTVGYTYLYWSSIALAGNLIDTSINPTQIDGPLVGPARPASRLTEDSFWYQGLNVGGSIRF